MSILHIRDTENMGLSFDLEHLLDALAPRSLAASWVVSDVAGESIDATGMSSGILESLEQTGERISGTVLMAIARKAAQVIWGEFTGYLPGDAGQSWVVIRAIDSTFWEVVTTDQQIVDSIRAKFNDAREVDTPWVDLC